jgi:hypothetical protein
LKLSDNEQVDRSERMGVEVPLFVFYQFELSANRSKPKKAEKYWPNDQMAENR